MASPLFSKIDVGALSLPHRVAMAPLTRNRAGEGNVPVALNATYYRQRASAALIVSEATQVAPKGQGYPRTPGIHSEAQVEGWKKVTEAVHEAGGRIFLQLWHVGRISHSAYHDGERPVAPSAVEPEGQVLTPDLEMVPFETPRPLDTKEVPQVVEQYRRGAENARRAGFDGVEIHGANGYLIDQFLRSGTNRRTDRYGGGLENRLRFLREVTEAVTGEWAADRVGLRLSPLSRAYGIADETPEATFSGAAAAANDFDLAYLHLVEPSAPKPPVVGEGETATVFAAVREAFDGALVANGNYDRETATDAIERGYADLVAFGRAFLANPDLPRRLRDELPINVPDEETFYNGDEHGYTDYPTWDELQNGATTETLDSLQHLAPRG
ncbi:alkene reductase [Salinibacter sp. 10B]|uniref:alkene reductase n=1 Tax=Salinibacter sp. 10B TaxID=1923971 RepID=UPI000CF40B31|nr:alkene reductase [Salinibacter sp. 10B]PQJ33674.1 alkene reductase [Salinibacter sp. 10B]